MSQTAFELMKSAALKGLPKYAQQLADQPVDARKQLVKQLQSLSPEPLTAQVAFLQAIEQGAPNSNTLLTSLSAEQLMPLRQAVDSYRQQDPEGQEKQTLLLTFNLLEAHYFYYHVSE